MLLILIDIVYTLENKAFLLQLFFKSIPSIYFIFFVELACLKNTFMNLIVTKNTYS